MRDEGNFKKRESREGQYTYVIYSKEKEGKKLKKEDSRGNEIPVGIVTLDEDLPELEELARSAGYDVLFEIIQKRNHPNSKTFVGKGKLEEVKETLAKRSVPVLLFNGELKPSQHYLLESELGVECVDRIRLVLNIFSTRASSRESQLQVLRAKLIYEIPLLREWIHNAKAGEHPGFLGGGAYETDAYYELIRRQLSRIDGELQKLDVNHSLRRQQRRKRGFSTVAIAGYTNAGKSSLLNALTSEKVLVEDRLFSTLATTTGRLEGENKPILITDTIGFLGNLPHFLIESFKSTIDEVYFADLVILVIDASDSVDEVRRKIETSRDILFPEVDASSIIIVLNKLDCADELPKKRALAAEILPARDILATSVRTGNGIKILHDVISSTFQYPVEMRFRLPHGEGVEPFLSWLHSRTEVVQVKYDQEVEVHLFCQEKDHANIVNKIVSLGGQSV
ncbi:MAG: GTPase HflX [Methanomassiliicoccus sp.]|nr:GTPase HflX [Methanomassiliicoccus sp.]